MTLPFVPWRADNVWFRVVLSGGAFDPVRLVQAWSGENLMETLRKEQMHGVCPDTEGVKLTDTPIFFFF